MYSFYKLMNSKEVIEELEGIKSENNIIKKTAKNKKSNKKISKKEK